MDGSPAIIIRQLHLEIGRGRALVETRRRFLQLGLQYAQCLGLRVALFAKRPVGRVGRVGGGLQLGHACL